MISYHEVILEFFKSRFGPTIGSQLFDIHLGKANLNSAIDLDEMSLEDQQIFVNNFLEGVFHEFYPKDKISRLKILSLLKFALVNAVERMEQMTSSKVDVSDLSVNSAESINYFSKSMLDDPEIKLMGFKFEGDFEGSMVLQHPDSVVRYLGTMVVKTMMGMEGDIEEEMLMQAMPEFYNIIIPTFTDVIGNTLNTDFKFLPMQFQEIKDVYEGDKQFIQISITNIEINIGKDSLPIKAHIYFSKIPDEVKKLLAENTSKLGANELKGIVAKRGPDRMVALLEFVQTINTGKFTMDELQELVKASNVKSINNISDIELTRLSKMFFNKLHLSHIVRTEKGIYKNLKYLLKY